MESDISAFTTELIIGFCLGFVFSWSVGLAPAFIYRYLVFRRPIEKKRVRWLLAPIVIILAIAFKTIADPSPFGGPARFNPNPIPWIILYFIGKWIMTRESRSKIKHGFLLFSYGLFVLISAGTVLIGSYINEMIPDEAEVKESIQEDPVHLALTQGDIQKMKQLLDAGASPNKTIMRGHTPLITASRIGHPGVVSLLLQSGANPKHKDDLGWTPLHHAILEEQANLSVVTMLVEAGADVNAQDHRLRTPLHRAAQYGHVDVVRYLLKNGANPNLKDSSDWTPSERIEWFGTADEATNAKIREMLKANQ